MDMPTAEQIVAIARQPSRGVANQALDELLHQFSPRVRFLKTLPRNAKVLDLGAGGGGAAIFRSWLAPNREDLELYATDMVRGEHFNLYHGVELADFNQSKPDFGGMAFDAIHTAHFAEHVEIGPIGVAAWAAGRLKPGGRLYIEIPSARSKMAPRREELLALGMNVSTTNFFDDATHIATVTLAELTNSMERAGLAVQESGIWQNDYLADELLRRPEQYPQTMGVWLKCGFCQYAIGVRA